MTKPSNTNHYCIWWHDIASLQSASVVNDESSRIRIKAWTSVCPNRTWYIRWRKQRPYKWGQSSSNLSSLFFISVNIKEFCMCVSSWWGYKKKFLYLYSFCTCSLYFHLPFFPELSSLSGYINSFNTFTKIIAKFIFFLVKEAFPAIFSVSLVSLYLVL